jgi:hypothetical protein
MFRAIEPEITQITTLPDGTILPIDEKKVNAAVRIIHEIIMLLGLQMPNDGEDDPIDRQERQEEAMNQLAEDLSDFLTLDAQMRFSGLGNGMPDEVQYQQVLEAQALERAREAEDGWSQGQRTQRMWMAKAVPPMTMTRSMLQ